MISKSAAALLVAFAAQAAAAQEVRTLGTLTGEIDGEPQTWVVTIGERDGAPTSLSGFYGDPSVGFVIVAIVGHASEGTIMEDKGSLSVSFEATTLREPAATEGVIGYGGPSRLGDQIGLYASTNGGRATVALDDLRPEPEGLFVSGAFEGTMVFKGLTADAPRPEASITVENGRFEALIPPGDE